MINDTFGATYFFDGLKDVIENYINVLKDKIHTKRVFLCVSILGCKNMVSENNFNMNYKGIIDRDTILCAPIVVENIDDDKDVERAIKWFRLEYALALGIKTSSTLSSLVKEILEE